MDDSLEHLLTELETLTHQLQAGLKDDNLEKVESIQKQRLHLFVLLANDSLEGINQDQVNRLDKLKKHEDSIKDGLEKAFSHLKLNMQDHAHKTKAVKAYKNK